MTVYNKLVRDRIPEIIRQNGSECDTRTLDQHEFQHHLKIKLKEEVAEYLDSDSVDELADIMEVLHALAAVHGVDAGELERLRQEKAEARGGFQERILLIEVDER